jgi:chromosome segregation ATPase
MPPGTIDLSNGLSPMAAVVNQSPSPNRRISLTPAGTSKVLADLQTGVVNARNALENTKAQLRLSQRSVAQLTRQTEDLKEGRERLRLENEGLNNVVARKERLLQEVRFIMSPLTLDIGVYTFGPW